jgi:hypothetical protein
MPFRPAQKKFPPARFATDNAESELPSLRRAVAPASVPSQPTSTPATTSSPLPESSPPPPTDTGDDLPATVSFCHSSKRTSHNTLKSTLSNDSVINVSTSASNGADADAPDKARNPKKAKTSASSGDQGEPSEISVIDTEDINDPDDEQLNKSQPTADIKCFFVPVPVLPGQTK